MALKFTNKDKGAGNFSLNENGIKKVEAAISALEGSGTPSGSPVSPQSISFDSSELEEKITSLESRVFDLEERINALLATSDNSEK